MAISVRFKRSFRYALIALGVVGIILAGATAWIIQNPRAATGLAFGVNLDPVELELRDIFEDRSADAKTIAIVAAAKAFLASLDPNQREEATYMFSDNAQRSNWSNFPEGMIPRGGLRIGKLSIEQDRLMDALISEIMSEEGVLNLEYQLAAERTFPTDDPRGEYGVEKFYVAFLGEPSETQPWMFQFGDHHLGINVTIYGADTKFSPMLTGGQPLNIDYEDENIYITKNEVTAAHALLDSLTLQQRDMAVRSDRAINLLLGPGEFGTVVAPEGIRGSDLNKDQRELLIALIETRLEFINDDDFAIKMASVLAELDDTYFGWWGPWGGPPGFAYFRVAGPSLILEYAPQDTQAEVLENEHAHSMYRNPGNDYGEAWVGAIR